jgi:ABC-type lipoprotein export system ATPase subunit
LVVSGCKINLFYIFAQIIPNMIAVKNLHFAYSKAQVFHFPDFQCQSGEQLLLLGQSGCGKTTLLHLIGGLLQPEQGTIKIAGTDTTALSTSQLDYFRGQNIGIIFQKNHFVAALNVIDNVLLAQHLAGKKQDKDKAFQLLTTLNIADKSRQRPEQLSQGEQQRVAIARALINEPKIILADEPTSALDDVNCAEVIQLLEQQTKATHTTLLIVTHDNRLKTRFTNQIVLPKK